MKRINILNKKAQVTGFIIVAIVIIIIILLLFFYYQNDIKYALADDDIKKVVPIMEECLEMRALDAVRLVGLQGGYVKLPNDHLYIEPFGTSYGYFKGVKTLLTLKEIEKEINSYILLTLQLCVEPEYFPGLKISFGDPKVNSKIKDDFVAVSAKLPVYANKEDKSFTITRDINTNINIKLGKQYKVAEEIIDRTSKDPSYIDLDYISSTEFYIVAVPYSDDEMLYTITDNSLQIPYTFRFANKF
ncbi:MAG: hypothetical protein ABIH37_01915 [archaeon]